MNATALIAEDEPLLAANLASELARLWPELRIVANVRHGAAAVEVALAEKPDVVFLDIRMPGMTGLEAAQALAEDWPGDPGTAPLPLVVFVTAYDQYALQAFEQAAVDYVLKPVQADRLRQTVSRVQASLKQRAEPAGGQQALDATLAQLRCLLMEAGRPGAPGTTSSVSSTNSAGATGSASSARMASSVSAPDSPPPAAGRLTVIQAAVGATIHLVPVAEVIYFEAADKYVRVVAAEREYLVRLSLRELLPRLDPQQFWQVHRGTVVRADAIATAVRDESGKVALTLRGHGHKLVASRLYAHLFKAM